MFRIIFWGMLLTSGSKMVKSQVNDQKPESKFITNFHFRQLSGGVILIKATFNDIPDSLNFILDTGSGAISLDSTTAAEFNIPNYPSGLKISGIAGVRPVNVSRNNRLNFPGLSIDSLDFFINNYDILSSVYGFRIDGVIGHSFFSRYIVAIDYDKLIISVYTPGTFKYPRGSYFLKPVIRSLPIQSLMIEDERTINGNFYLDTGAGLCFLLTSKFVSDSSFLKKKRKLVPILVQGMGGKKALELTVIKRVKIGRFVFRNVPTNIFDDEFNALSYPHIGGLIGNDILRRFNVVINYKEGLFALKPNTHFRDLFDYSYSGMNMYMDENGQIIIDDIMKNSPAERYGLKNGDVVIGINKNLSNDLTTYRNLIQDVSKKVSFLILRDGKIEDVRVKIGKIR